jgi:hypothetical protein
MKFTYIESIQPESNAILRNILILLLSFSSLSTAIAQAFVHPGIFHMQADFDRMKEKVNGNAQPWKGSWDKLVASAQAQLSWQPRATDTIRRGGAGDNVGLLYQDVAAAYQHALIWKITGDVDHGNKAVEILNAWSSIHKFLSGNADRYLASGLFGYQFANAAEMMRGYSGFDLARFQSYLLNVYYYPLVERFLLGNSYGTDHNDACITNYRANWDLCNMAAMIAIGVLCDNRTIYNKGIEYFKNGAGNGSIKHAALFVHSSTLAQWEESGRDQGHTFGGISLMAHFCQIAWNQGDDMFSYDDNRFRKAAEYVASYNLGNTVPYTPHCWGTGQNCSNICENVISETGRGNFGNNWEIIYNHYARVRGQESLIPNIAAVAAQVRPEGGPSLAIHPSTFDYPGFGSLTYSLDPISQAIPNGTYKIIARHSGKALEVANNGTANGSNVRQWTSNDCVCQRWMLKHWGNNQYTMVGAGSIKNLDVSGNSTADGANIQIWQPTGANNQRFTITATSGGFYRITPVHSGKAVDVSGASSADGANIIQWSYLGGANQQWSFSTTSATRSLVEKEESLQVQVFPNPTDNDITIHLPSSFDGEKTIHLRDATGKIIRSVKFKTAEYTLSIGDLPSGLYLMKIMYNQRFVVEKVIRK